MHEMHERNHLAQHLLRTAPYVDWRTEVQGDPDQVAGPHHRVTMDAVHTSGELIAKGRRNGHAFIPYVWRGHDLECERASLDAQWAADQPEGKRNGYHHASRGKPG